MTALDLGIAKSPSNSAICRSRNGGLNPHFTELMRLFGLH